MAEFLLLLGKLNLAMGAAIVLVYLLRRPLRTLFGAAIAYALWLLVPAAGLAILLPPRVVAAPPPALLSPVESQVVPMFVIKQHPALHIAEQLAGQRALTHPMIVERAMALGYAMPDYALLLFLAWVLGMAVMALYMARLQARFHAAVRVGEAGPAVLGFFRPRIVIPDTFQEQFSAPERAAILAHERVHLSRQDARINALAASLRCLCWFNPLIHLGTAWLRIDQELACDARAVGGPVSRRDYANALLKSQMMTAALPLGCNWPGSQHPLIERIALLKRERPGTARRIAGTALVVLAATSAGLGAWAAQPPVAAESVTGPQLDNRIALAKPLAMTSTSNQDAGQPAAVANPASGHDAFLPRRLFRLPAAGRLSVPFPDASQLLLATAAPIASNDPSATADEPQANTPLTPTASGVPNDQARKTAMKKIPLAAAALLTAQTALAQQGQAPICISTRNIADTSASPDGTAVFFRMTDGTIWRNQLRGRCPDLKWGGFSWSTTDPMERVCENEQTISAVQVPEVCALGKFTKLFPPGPSGFATGER